MFIDEIKVSAKAGHGGAGCIAFHREAFRPKGGPSGGNGGAGGSVILEASHDLNNLIAQFYQPQLTAENGRPGLGKRKTGRSGHDLTISVPCGTMVWRLEELSGPEDATGNPDDGDLTASDLPQDADETRDPEGALDAMRGPGATMKARGREMALEIDLENVAEDPAPRSGFRRHFVVDLTEHGQRHVLCQGGRGGLGNMNFATARRQVPRFAQPGEPGEEGRYLLELQTMADIGLVGYPNAGKSTLLTAISQARPKVAPYPFTTLHPQIGIVEYDNFRRLTVCDIPGLIAGAHENVGLGHAFLRHVERCKSLVILLDMAGEDGRKPWDDYHQLLQELEWYGHALVDKPRLVVANKMDEPAAAKHLRQFRKKLGSLPVLEIAAAFDLGIAEFRDLILRAVEANSPAAP